MQVRDVEAPLQEAVIDQIEALILSKAATAASSAAGSPTPVAEEAARSLCCLLAALAESASAARISLCHALGTMATKRRLKGDRVAKGLQNIIQGLGEGLLSASEVLHDSSSTQHQLEDLSPARVLARDEADLAS